MRIAIVGAGISGLVAAHLLHREHEIVVYEADAYAGGHTNTVRVDTDARDASRRHRLHRDERPQLPELHAPARPASASPRQPTHMSFSVKAEERATSSTAAPRAASSASRRNLVNAPLPAHARRPAALQPRAARAARRTSDGRRSGSLRDFLERHRFSRRVRRAADRAAGVRGVVGRPAPAVLASRRASSPSSSPTTACSAFATARGGRRSPAARRATSRR